MLVTPVTRILSVTPVTHILFVMLIILVMLVMLVTSVTLIMLISCVTSDPESARKLPDTVARVAYDPGTVARVT